LSETALNVPGVEAYTASHERPQQAGKQQGQEATMTNAQTATATQQPTDVNGLNVQAAFDTIDAIRAKPDLARFQFRARNRWIDGGVNRSTIRGFYGAGREDQSRTSEFVFTNGEPPVLLGANEGANPVEFLLHALAGCVTTTFVLHAMARGITIRSLSTELEGDIDLHGLLGMNDAVFPGYEQIRIGLKVEADCTEAELDDLIAYSKAHSPVCNTVCKPVPVMIERVAA
jgi:uncharacterized OsmC-like protein